MLSCSHKHPSHPIPWHAMHTSTQQQEHRVHCPRHDLLVWLAFEDTVMPSCTSNNRLQPTCRTCHLLQVPACAAPGHLGYSASHGPVRTGRWALCIWLLLVCSVVCQTFLGSVKNHMHLLLRDCIATMHGLCHS